MCWGEPIAASFFFQYVSFSNQQMDTGMRMPTIKHPSRPRPRKPWVCFVGEIQHFSLGPCQKHGVVLKDGSLDPRRCQIEGSAPGESLPYSQHRIDKHLSRLNHPKNRETKKNIFETTKKMCVFGLYLHVFFFKYIYIFN
jgi:hypothetical protein